MIAEATNATLLNGDQDTVFVGKFPNHINVQGLHESRIGNRHGDIGILLLNLICRNESLVQSSTKRKDGHAVLLLLSASVSVGFAVDSPRLANDASLTNGHNLALGGDLSVLELIPKEVLKLVGSVASSTRVSENSRSIIERRASGHHISQFNLITGRHNGQVGNASQVGQIVASMMSRSVVAHNTGAVQHESHGQVLDGHVVDHLIVAALHERRVDTAEGLEALARHTGREGDGVLLGNADVEGALGEAAAEDVHAGTAGHGGGDADDGPVLGGLLDE
mmetsp:Transcript_1232/g.3507  ORF Transcript_1232/g.3507 Transcript_1232/m.3507 type:complete len:279 (-) Transcript_1232:1230-2066(-)